MVVRDMGFKRDLGQKSQLNSYVLWFLYQSRSKMQLYVIAEIL